MNDFNYIECIECLDCEHAKAEGSCAGCNIYEGWKKYQKRIGLDGKEIPHGRLIDADELLQNGLHFTDVKSGYSDFYVPYSELVKRIKDAPTIIEAEG